MQENTRRGFAREIAFVDGVERCEVRGFGRAINIALEYLRERRPGGFETFLHLHEDDLGLALERQTFDLAGAGIERWQAGQEYKTAGEGDRIDRPFASAFEIARVRLYPQSLHHGASPS